MNAFFCFKRTFCGCRTWRFIFVVRVTMALAVGLCPNLGMAQSNGPTHTLAKAILNDDVEGSRAALAAGAEINAVIGNHTNFEISFTLPELAVVSGSSHVIPILLEGGSSREEFLSLATLACGLQSMTIMWYLSQEEFDASRCLVEAVANADPNSRFWVQNILSFVMTGKPEQGASASLGIDILEDFTLEDIEPRAPAIEVTDHLVGFVKILLDGGANPQRSVAVEIPMDGYARQARNLDAREAAAYFGEQLIFSLLADEKQSDFWALHVDLLVGCSRYKHMACIQTLLNDGILPNGADAVGSLALAAVARNNMDDALSALLDAGADPNRYGPSQEPPILSVTRRNSLVGIHLLADAGADLNTMVADEWPLRIATKAAEMETVRALLQHNADPNIRLYNGSSVLHDLDEEFTYFRKERILKPAHGPIARMLFAAGYRDNSQAPLLESYDASNDDFHWIMQELIALGAMVPISLLREAVSEKHTSWIEFLFSEGRGVDVQDPSMPLFFESLLQDKEYARAKDLLRFGMVAPRRLEDQTRGLLLALESNTELVRPMLAAGYRATDETARDDFYKLLIEGGHGALVPDFIAAGLPSDYSEEGSWPGLIHRILRGDVTMSTDSQKRAFAAFFAAGASVTRADALGQTPEKIAQSQPQLYEDYLRLLSILGLESTAPPLHKAVYARDIRLLRQTLMSAPSQLNVRNADGLTALNLALRLEATSCANALLAAGADIGLEPIDGLSDLDFAHRPELARQFRLRLLQRVITRLQTGTYLDDAQDRLDAFKDKFSILPAVEWTVECGNFCEGTTVLSANEKVGAFQTQASRTGSRVGYELMFDNGSMIDDWKLCSGSGCRGNGTAEFTTSASIKLDQCENPRGWPKELCFSEVLVNPVNWRGTQVAVVQNGREIAFTGRPIKLSRVNGPIEIVRARTRARGFPNQLSFKIDIGPQTDLPAIINQSIQPPNPSGFGLPQRMAVYAKLYRWTLEGDALEETQTHDSLLRASTLLTARELVSLKLAMSNHRLVVDTELGVYTRQMLFLKRSTMELRDLVLTSSTLSSKQFVALKLRMAQLRDSLELNSRERTNLTRILSVLEATSVGADEFHEALGEFEDDFLTWADDVIINYQGLLLESAQLYSLAEIGRKLALSETQRENVSSKLLPSDLRISRQALNGHGAALLEIAGLEASQ